MTKTPHSTLVATLICIAKNAGAMARDLLKCYAGSAEITFSTGAAQFTHN
jgi:hypothetical protein